MVRIMGDRATGKTIQLLCLTEQLAKKHPDETIYFVGNHTLGRLYQEKMPKNVKFITPMTFEYKYADPSSYVVIDEVESFLGGLGVKAYTLSLSDRVIGG